jgi:hypothetical protein
MARRVPRRVGFATGDRFGTPDNPVIGLIKCERARPGRRWERVAKVFLKSSQYLPWRYMILRDLVLSTVLAFGERVAERLFLPGLHRSSARALTTDPARIDDLSVLAADAMALLMLIWMFYLGLYTISLFTGRPIKPYAAALVGGGLMLITFVGSMAEWFAMPVPPPR